MNKNIRDLVIIGAGPAGLTAAIYAAREKLDILVVEKNIVGGMLATIDKIENYSGFPEGISGQELVEQMQKQAKKFGAEVQQFTEVKSINKTNNSFIIKTDNEDILAKTILLANGTDYRKLNIPGEAENIGKGVSYCATCDAALYQGKKVVAIGSGNSVAYGALFLAKFAERVDLVSNKPELLAQKTLLDEIVNNPKIIIHNSFTTTEIKSENGKITKITGDQGEIETDGVFIFTGLVANTGFLTGSGVELDEKGMIMADENGMTNIPGIFVAGDSRADATKQVIMAAADGAKSAINISKFLKEN